MKKYLEWINHPNLDLKLKQELEQMNDKQKEDAFYTNIEFGTAGMRGILGAGTNRINLHTIRKATQGFCNYIISNGNNNCARGVAIAYDNRHMSYEFAMDCSLLLAKNNIKSYVFESLRPTPELSFAVRSLNCFGGIMITASHNPKEHNGYKLYDETGCQLVPAIAQVVIDEVNSITDELAINVEVSDEQKGLITIIGSEIDEKYYSEVLKIQLNSDLDKSNIKVVFSPEHGTANVPVPHCLNTAGYNVIRVLEQCDPDPDFSGTKTPNPEELAAYDLSVEYGYKNNADIILVCDPDADRMGVGVMHNNQYQILTGNQSGSILIEYILSQLTIKNSMPNNPVMFNTVVTSDLGEKIANKYGVECEKTLTGFKFIGEKVAQYEKDHSKSYVFGYEESYGSLISPFVRDKDAPQACLMLAEAACYYKHLGKTLVDVLNDLYAEHGFYSETQKSLSLSGKQGAEKIKSILENLRNDVFDSIRGYKVLKFEDYQKCIIVQNGETTPLTGFARADVLKFYLEDGSWIAVRPSGTEPKCKFYFCVKGDTMQKSLDKTKLFHNESQKWSV